MTEQFREAYITPIPEEQMRQEALSEVYQWNDGRARQPLPIDGYLSHILTSLDQNPVVIVQAETGVGKTTRIPQAIIDSNPDTHVYVTQTRRPAVRMNGARIAEELGCEPGETVGWRLRGETPQISSQTRLELLIDQSLTNQIRREGKLPPGVIMIDEAHERSVQLDVLLALVKQYLPSSPETKVVVTSATIDAEKFSKFFDDAPAVEIKNKHLFPVEVMPQRLLYGEHHVSGIMRAADTVLKKFADNSLTIPPMPGDAERIPVTSGTIPILLSGKDEIRDVIRFLQRQAEILGIRDRIEILECHSMVSSEDQKKLAHKVPKDTLRFVCATEMVRSSVTLPQVVGVIDSLQVKRNTVQNGISHLAKVTVSGAEADQGKGRAGRQQPGFYIPISYNQDYENITDRRNAEYWPQPAIKRDSLGSVILQIKAMGLDIRTLPMLDKPREENIATTIDQLHRIGALDASGELTDLGKKLVEVPLDPERAVVLFEAQKEGVLPEAIVAMAISEQEGIFFLPSEQEKRNEAVAVWKQFADGADSDFSAMVQAYRQYKQKQRTVRNAGELREWVIKHFLNEKKLRIVDGAILTLCDVLNDTGINTSGSPFTIRQFDSDALSRAMIMGFIDGISVQENGAYYQGLKGSFLKSFNSVCPSDASVILADGIRKSVSARRGRENYYADRVARISAEWVEEKLPSMCSENIVEDSVEYDSVRDVVVGRKQKKFHQFVMKEEQVVIDDDRAVNSFAHALALGKIDSPMTQQNTKTIQMINNLWVRSGGVIPGNPEFTQQISTRDVYEFYKKRLNGIHTRKDLETALEAGLVDLTISIDQYIPVHAQEEILANNPDTLIVDGTEYSVVYSYSLYDKCPRATIQMTSSNIFASETIPELPHGRRIHVELIDDDGDLIKTYKPDELPDLPDLVWQLLVNKQWNAWRLHGTIPPLSEDLSQKLKTIGEDDDIELPQPLVYGTDPESGEALYAYAGLSVQTYGEDLHANILYYSTEEEAHAATEASQLVISQKKESLIQEKQEREELVKKLGILNETISALQNGQYSTDTQISSNLPHAFSYLQDVLSSCDTQALHSLRQNVTTLTTVVKRIEARHALLETAATFSRRHEALMRAYNRIERLRDFQEKPWRRFLSDLDRAQVLLDRGEIQEALKILELCEKTIEHNQLQMNTHPKSINSQPAQSSRTIPVTTDAYLSRFEGDDSISVAFQQAQQQAAPPPVVAERIVPETRNVSLPPMEALTDEKRAEFHKQLTYALKLLQSFSENRIVRKQLEDDVRKVQAELPETQFVSRISSMVTEIGARITKLFPVETKQKPGERFHAAFGRYQESMQRIEPLVESLSLDTLTDEQRQKIEHAIIEKVQKSGISNEELEEIIIESL